MLHATVLSLILKMLHLRLLFDLFFCFFSNALSAATEDDCSPLDAPPAVTAITTTTCSSRYPALRS